jgi:hypothetical protein
MRQTRRQHAASLRNLRKARRALKHKRRPARRKR